MKENLIYKKGNMKVSDPENPDDHCMKSMGEEGNPPKWDILEKIIIKGDIEELQNLILNHEFLLIFRPKDAKRKQSLLHKAVEADKPSIIKYLIAEIQSRKISIDFPDYNGRTPLFTAATQGNLNALEMLIENGAHINARDNQGNSPLHDIVNELEKSLDRGNQDAKGFGEKEHQNIILGCLSKLIENSECDLEAHNKSNMTPLTYAVNKLPVKNASQKAQCLIQACIKLITGGAYIDSVDERGKSVREMLQEKELANIIVSNKPQQRLQRTFLSKFLDLVILCKHNAEISDFLKSGNRLEKVKAVNLFLGNRTILFHAVDRNDIESVNVLLDNGANPWQEEENGKLCLHRAFSRGNLSIMDTLIENMKLMRNVTLIDLRKYSFDLLKIFFTDSKNSISVAYSEYVKCFTRLLNDDIELDLNAKDTLTSRTILQLAAIYNNQDILKLLIEKGIFIGSSCDEDDAKFKGMLDVITLSTLNEAMDNCIHYHHSEGNDRNDEYEENTMNDEYTLYLNYKFLVPPNKSDELKSKVEGNNQKEGNNGICKKNKEKSFSEVKTLRDIGQKKSLRRAITHPLLQTFIYAKWRKIMWFFYFNLLLYSLFVVFLTLFLYALTDLRVLHEPFVNSTIPEPLPQDIATKTTEVNAYMAFLLPLTLYIFLRELFQMIWTFHTYRRNFENYIEWTLVILVVLFCSATFSVNITRHLAAWGMIIAWYEFIFILGRIPTLAIYVTMLRKVSRNFLKLLFLYSTLIIAFSVSFNIILKPTASKESGASFSNFWSTIPRALVMATGEFEYGNLRSNLFSPQVFFTTSAVLMFLVFLFLIFLVLMNVMNGLAVTNTQAIMQEAVLYSLQSRLDLIFMIEKMIDSIPAANWLLLNVLRYEKDLISGNQKPRFLVEVNNPHKWRRIKYGEDDSKFKHCSLDKRTAELLRQHRVDLIRKERNKLKTNSIDDCLELLMEIKERMGPNIPY